MGEPGPKEDSIISIGSVEAVGAPNELFCKKAVLQWVFFAGKNDSLSCLAGKMKYICWETI